MSVTEEYRIKEEVEKLNQQVRLLKTVLKDLIDAVNAEKQLTIDYSWLSDKLCQSN